MARHTVRGVVALGAIVALAVTGCGSKETKSEKSGGTGALSIKPLEQVDKQGKPVDKKAGGNAADPAGDGKAKCSNISLGFAGALTGDNAALGKNIRYGMEVAIKKHNDANKDCQVSVKEFDTEGTPEKATQVAPSIIGDAQVIGLLGPAFSGESNAVDSQFNEAGLAAVTASATNPTLSQNGWKTFFRGLANDAVQGPALAAYVKNEMKAKNVCLIKDDSDYGKGFAAELKTGLGDLVKCEADTKTKDKEFSAIVTKVKEDKPDVVVYAGYYAEAAPLAQQLKEGGVDATFVSGDGVNDPAFVDGAGSASKGAILSCPCGPAPDAFAADYKKVSGGAAPGVYSTEGYDLTTIMLKAIDSGVTDRKAMVDYVRKYDGDGLARHYKWDANGELEENNIWIYEVK
ncbi:branched-chain amino acid ABC transporter substrate-binding protein [Cumulibacter manganitolerans]|uniref:branched-chain amino acid ABC transporter substrate-binding protein n=1 Tax=Cumulibacter manganitolerans TaxID=1884992 RepID=UPI001295F5CE|nr:branched-chain amino acid ABC transporter substrate-binding protein [Cumulibacter manganitolerans]